MPIVFDHNPLLNPNEARALEKAITEGIGDSEGDYHCSFHLPLGPVLYVIHLRTPQGKIRLEIEGIDQLRLESVREAVRGAMSTLVAKTRGAGS